MNNQKKNVTFKDVADLFNIPKTVLVGDNLNKRNTKYKDKEQDDFSRLRVLFDDNAQKINDAHGAIELLPDLALVIQTAVSTTLSPIDLTKVDITFKVHPKSPETLLGLLNEYFNNKSNFDLSSEIVTMLSESKYYYGSYITIFLQPSMIDQIVNLNTRIMNNSVQPKYYNKVAGLPIVDNQNNLINQSKQSNIKATESFSPVDMDIINGKCNAGFLSKSSLEFLTISNESLNTSDYFIKHKDESRLILKEDKSLESLTSINLSLVELTDNPFVLAKPYANELMVKNNNRSILSRLGFEGYEEDNLKDDKSKVKPKQVKSNEFVDDTDEDNVYLNRVTDQVPTQSLVNIKLTDEEKIKYKPILIKCNPESVIPIIKPGKVSEHVGYLIILDENGYQLSANKDSNYYLNLTKKLKEKIVSAGNNSMFFQNPTFKLEDQIAFKPLFDKYKEQLEEKVSSAIKDSSLLSELKIDFPEELFSIIFSRQLSNQKTRVLYLPEELVSYIAFNFNNNGIGVSLLEKTKLYTSLRAILLFASIIAGINNSIPAKKMSIKLDEDDIAPRERIEDIMETYAKLQAGTLQIGTLQPYDLIESLNKASISLDIDGGEQFPNTKIEMVELPKNHIKPDQELMDYLRKAQYAGLEETPEVVDNTYEGEFATSIVNRNLLRARRFLDSQLALTSTKHGVSEFVQKYILAGGDLLKDIKDLYNSLPEKDKKELSFKEMISCIEVCLPSPDLSIVNARLQAYEEFSKLAETVITAYISDDMIGDLLKGDELPGTIDAIKLAILKRLQREYLKTNNIFPEIESLLYNQDIKVEDELSDHYEFMMKLISNVLKVMRKAEPKYNDIVKKVEEALSPDGVTPDDDSNDDEENLDEEPTDDEFTDLETDTTSEEEPSDTPEDNTPDETPVDNTDTNEDTTKDNPEEDVNLDEFK